MGGSATNTYLLDSFLQGMQDLGYVEGRDVDIACRYAHGDLSRMSDLANDLVQLKPKVFVTGTVNGTQRSSRQPPQSRLSTQH
jgi:hypothetical protein